MGAIINSGYAGAISKMFAYELEENTFCTATVTIRFRLDKINNPSLCVCACVCVCVSEPTAWMLKS